MGRSSSFICHTCKKNYYLGYGSYSSCKVEIDDSPTIISFYDTVNVLEKRNANLRKCKLNCMIFAWQASIFLYEHALEVCKDIEDK